MAAKTQIALGAIARNEGPYLLEWVAWHTMLGFDAIVICDNESDDGSTRLLAAMDQAGLVSHVPYPDPEDAAPQYLSYSDMIMGARGAFDWLALVDLDEYLMPMGERSLKDCLVSLPPDCGGVAFNWAIFGSNGLYNAEPDSVRLEPTLTRFVRRAPRDVRVNTYVKSMIRPDLVDLDRGVSDPHVFPLKDGARYYRPAGTVAALPTSGDFGQTQEVSWDGFRVNHYAIRSRGEFFLRKCARGFPDQSGARADFDFRDLDRNQVLDVPRSELMAAFEAVLADHRARVAQIDPEAESALAPTSAACDLAPRFRLDGVYWCAAEQCYVVNAWFSDGSGRNFDRRVRLSVGHEGIPQDHSRQMSYHRSDGFSPKEPPEAFSGLRLWFHGMRAPEAGEHVALLDTGRPISLPVELLASEADLPPLAHERKVSPAAAR